MFAAQRAARGDVVARDDAIVAARRGALGHAVARKVTVVAAHAAAAVQVVAVLVTAIPIAAEETLVSAEALTVFAGLTGVVVTGERESSGHYGEKRYPPSHRRRA